MHEAKTKTKFDVNVYILKGIKATRIQVGHAKFPLQI